MSKGINHRRKMAISHLVAIGTEKAQRMADMIWDKLKRRGEWKFKTKPVTTKKCPDGKKKGGKSKQAKGDGDEKA